MCSDEVATYPDEGAADADVKPNVICDDCGRPKLRVKALCYKLDRVIDPAEVNNPVR
jgi:hypothetical protein